MPPEGCVPSCPERWGGVRPCGICARILPPPGQGGKEAYGKRPGPAPPPVPSLTISDFRVGFQGSKQIAHAHVVA